MGPRSGEEGEGEMSARILDGAQVARQIRAEVAVDVKELQQRVGRPPGLTVIQVGEHRASVVYIRNKARAAEKTGIRLCPPGAMSPRPHDAVFG